MEKGSVFSQTGSNAIILYNSVAPDCITRVATTKSQKVLYERVKSSSRPRPRIRKKSAWQLNQDGELTRRVQETDSQNTSQEETQSPDEKEECSRKKGDQDETRSVEKHQETGSPNQDREVTESSDERHRETR